MRVNSVCLDTILKEMKLEDKYVLVHFSEQDNIESRMLYDEIKPIYDNNDNLVIYALISNGLTDYYNKDRINWFRFYDEKGVKNLCKSDTSLGI